MSASRAARGASLLPGVFSLTLCLFLAGCETTPKFADQRIVKMTSKTAGTVSWPKGDRYTGSLVNGVPNGNGTMNYANGDVYTGGFRDGWPHGTGTKRYRSGSVYEGGWHRGAKKGKGAYRDASGETQEGIFDGKLVNGVRITANKQKLSGRFSNGVISQGEIIWADGSRYKGYWNPKTGRHVQGERYNAAGLLVAAGYWEGKDGKASGYVARYNTPDGRKSIEEYFDQNGLRNGWSRSVGTDRSVYVGRYENDKRVGYWLRLEPRHKEGGSQVSIYLYNNIGQANTHSDTFRWRYPKKYFQGTPQGWYISRDAKGQLSAPESFSAQYLNLNMLFVGKSGDAEGLATGEAETILLTDMLRDIRPNQLLTSRSSSPRDTSDFFKVIERTVWEAGNVKTAELGKRDANQFYYIGGIDEEGRPHGIGMQSRATNTPGTTWVTYDNNNLEEATYEHGKSVSYTSYKAAMDSQYQNMQREHTANQRERERRRQAESAQERAEERAEAQRVADDRARREARRAESKAKAARTADRWNAAQAQRKQEANQFSRQVQQHNRNLAKAFDETKAAQERQRQAAAQKQREADERARIAREQQAQRAEAERRRQAEAQEAAERQRVAALEAEQQRKAAEAKRQQEAEQARLEREKLAKAEAEKSARAKTTAAAKVAKITVPAPTGLTPPPNNLPETPQGTFTAWMPYAEARDGTGKALIRLEYRLKRTKGLGDEPYVHVAWRVTNLSGTPIYDAAVTDKHYTTDLGTKHANTGETFKSHLAAGETDANLPDVIEGSRMETFQLQQPGLKLRTEKSGELTHWHALGSVRYF